MQPLSTKLSRGAKLAIVVAALGYFVDVYDLIIFSIVRVSSLESLGIEKTRLVDMGAYILNMQLIGLLIGGVIWGILGDKRGRIGILFGSILIYSCANIANAYVSSIEAYAFCRLVAGFGLAGEIGAGITLVSELMPRHSRGYATALVVTLGVAGSLAAALVGDFTEWRTAFLIGGILGMTLLVLRVSVHESGLFEAVRRENVQCGNFFALFASRARFFRYLSCIAVGLPIWFGVAVLLAFSPEIAAALGVAEPIKVATATVVFTIGSVSGDLSSGLLSQYFRTRKRIIAAYLILNGLVTATLFLAPIRHATSLLVLYGFVGFSIGYWAVLVTTAAEQFGTNLRATVTTTVPNFVRGAAVPMTWSFAFLRDYFGTVGSLALVGAVALLGASLAMFHLHETFSRDLNFLEMPDSKSQLEDLPKAA